MASRPLRLEDPRRLGDYQLLARLGEGGMGTVFLGRDPAGRHVAVKAIRREYANNEEFRARFRSEVNRARQVPSFCTAAVLDADPDHDIPYLVVEYVDGPSLQEVVTERGPMSAGDLHSIAVGVAAALTAIHGAGVIHRDLKPTNVLLSLGLPKVIDFGIARALEATSQHTRTDHFVGTMAYMAPERLDSAAGLVTPAADIFAWGAVVAYAGTGRSPFGGDNPLATAAQILTRPPDLRGIPESLLEPVERSLSKDPCGRPTANELVQELLAVSTPKAAVPADATARPETGRFDARKLFEQLIAEGPNQAAAPVVPVPVHAPHKRGIRRLPSVISPARVVTRRLILALVALLLASVAAATVAYARTTDGRSSTGAGTKTATPTTKRSVRGPSFFDPLNVPGRFRESSGDSGRCTFHDGQLWARVNGKTTYQCPGPEDAFAGDQSIAVDLGLTSARACAMIWFRYRGDRSYQMTACAGQLELEQLDGAILTSLGQVPVPALQPGTRHRVSIVIANQHGTVAIDGTDILEAAVSAPDLASGRILLGVTSAGSTSNTEVSFANLDVRAS